METTRLLNMFVKNISAVKKPANGRTFLLMKADVAPHKPADMQESAVDEFERLYAEYVHAHPAATRRDATNAVFAAHPGLYERCRREETVATHGERLSEIYDRAKAPAGLDPRNGSDNHKSIDARVAAILSKSEGVTAAEAADAVFSNDPAAFEQWRAESFR